MSYFEILPVELKYLINTKIVGICEIYHFIEVCKLDHDIAFKMLCDIYCPFFKKYNTHQKFRGRHISWCNIFDNILEHMGIRGGIPQTLLSFHHSIKTPSKEYAILLLHEYEYGSDIESLAYECIINSFRNPPYSSLELYNDIIKLAIGRYNSKMNNIALTIGPSVTSLLTDIPHSIYIYRNTNFVVWRGTFVSGVRLSTIGVLENRKLRIMTDAEIIVSEIMYDLPHTHNADLSIYRIKIDG